MLYNEVVKELMEGKFVGRRSWESEGGYLVYLPGLTHFLKVTLLPKSNVVPWAADITDSMADDWEVMDKEKALSIQSGSNAALKAA